MYLDNSTITLLYQVNQNIINIASVAPFEIGVNFDENERWAANTGNALDNDWTLSPGGIIGKCLFLYLKCSIICKV